MIQVDISNIWSGLSLPDLLETEKEVSQAHAALAEQSREEPAGEQIQQLLDAAHKIREDSDVCLVLGGGLAVRGAMELLQGRHRNLTREKPWMLFAGDSLSTRQWNELMTLLEGRDFSLILLAREDHDLAAALAFRSLDWMLERKYGTDEASGRIYVVAGPGELEQRAREEQWHCLTGEAGGLLPLAVAGLDIHGILRGAAQARQEYDLRSFENPLWLYAGARAALGRRGRRLEWVDCAEPDFQTLGLWWQRRFREIGGVQSVPAAASPGPDQFATMVRFEGPEKDFTLGAGWKADGLEALEGKTLAQLQERALESAAADLADAGLPVMTMDCNAPDEASLGELLYFLDLARGLCSRMDGEKSPREFTN